MLAGRKDTLGRGGPACMIAKLLMGLVADVLFGWVSSGGRSFHAEIMRYMERRRLVVPGAVKKSPTR
jgi:hypothetical protein